MFFSFVKIFAIRILLFEYYKYKNMLIFKCAWMYKRLASINMLTEMFYLVLFLFDMIPVSVFFSGFCCFL